MENFHIEIYEQTKVEIRKLEIGKNLSKMNWQYSCEGFNLDYNGMLDCKCIAGHARFGKKPLWYLCPLCLCGDSLSDSGKDHLLTHNRNRTDSTLLAGTSFRRSIRFV
jgi:hypothetical protein